MDFYWVMTTENEVAKLPSIVVGLPSYVRLARPCSYPKFANPFHVTKKKVETKDSRYMAFSFRCDVGTLQIRSFELVFI